MKTLKNNTLLLTSTLTVLLGANAALPAAAACLTPPNGIIAWWQGDAGASDIIGSNNGTFVGGVGMTNGVVGQAFSFNGVSQYIDIPSSAVLNSPTTNLTLEAWVFPRVQNNFTAAPIIKKAGEGLAQQNGYTLEIGGNGGAVFGVCVTGDPWWSITTSPPLPLNKWTHVAGVFTGTSISVYVNGVLAILPVPVTKPIVPSSNNLQIGHDPSNPGFFFNGLIDEPTIYDRALSAAEIAAIYAAGTNGKCYVCTPHKAVAKAIIINGFLVGAEIEDAGCGYTNSPVVLIQGGGGEGATAAAEIRDGRVTKINVANAGCCYTSLPEIIIASPPFVPSVSISLSRIMVTQNVALGRKYVLEASSDLIIWTPTAEPFIAQSEVVKTEFEISPEHRYFRLREVP